MSEWPIIISVVALGFLSVFAGIFWFTYRKGAELESLRNQKRSMERAREIEKVAHEAWNDIDSKQHDRRNAVRKRVLAEMRALANRSAKLSDIK